MIISFVNRKLQQEYYHLSLWYFVSFIAGIMYFFSSDKFKFLTHRPEFLFVVTIISIVLLVYVKNKEKLSLLFLISIISFF